MTPLQQAQKARENAAKIATAGKTPASESLALCLTQMSDSARLSKPETIFACATLLASSMVGLKKDEEIILAMAFGYLGLLVKSSLDAQMAATPKTEGEPI